MNEKALKWIMGWITLWIIISIIIPVAFHLSLGFLGIMALAIIFWLSMLIDCLQRSEDNFPLPGQYEKLIWSLILIFLNAIGAILYFSLVLLNTNGKKTETPEKMA
ncbi:PLDc N-terminal domain-containing protein [Methanolobus mangrovi]|uniref:PLDc N-terminal domain-containing protein n=1 Tax=Methanolobus mangrovi TaxID=3072977 RepID=A0AA51UHU4_9EURY|nr:PLDc N-terminal domain-containing protein [Methanolobus mangrovi]WMW23395.1 PLDc N-terminal domain-containing protein [Methanolobus mangrovi]